MKQSTRKATTAPIIKTRLHILSASYGPADGRKLYNGVLVDYAQRRNETYVPNSRDVLPFLKALISTESDGVFQEVFNDIDINIDVLHDGQLESTNSSLVASVSNASSNSNCAFPLMDGRPMNAVFGDPCPGTTKLLHIEYVFRDYVYDDVADNVECAIGQASAESNGNERGIMRGGMARSPHSRCTSSRIFTATFREHERVVLKRQDPLFPLATSDSSDDRHHDGDGNNGMQIDLTSNVSSPPTSILATAISTSSTMLQQQWKLAPTISEITLPIILPFLTVRQRAKCQLVCSSWKHIVLEKGIAVVVDINDVGLFPKTKSLDPPTIVTSSNFTTSPTHKTITKNFNSSITNRISTTTQNICDHQSSRSLLRGLLNHSFSSLEALVLNDFISLRPELDLHPALPYLRKLRRLDISRIPTITDETLSLISIFIGQRLEVLYMKGLGEVTNDGIVQLVQSCCNIRVLDVSQVHQLDDTAGIAIGQYLTKLEVLHGKDNFKLTNRSVDLITRNCRNLVQVTLWGSIRLTHISFHEEDDGDAEEHGYDGGASLQSPANPLPASVVRPLPMKLVLLNLWGCHNLTDAAAHHLNCLLNLRSLCVSECHRLTDQFVYGISQSLTRLLHLQLRYVRRITDASLKSISQSMPWLYSLDVSFCTKLTIQGLSQLLIERCNSLSELRLYSCRSLNIEAINSGGGTVAARVVGGGHQLVRALRSVHGASILSFLDLRECQHYEVFSRDATWLQAMVDLGFHETLHGLFTRPAYWNDDVRKQLMLCSNY